MTALKPILLAEDNPRDAELALAAMGAKTLGRAAAGLGGNLGGKVAGAAGVLGNLLGGIAVLETVFTLPGLGRLLVDAVFARDYPVVQGVLLFTAVSLSCSIHAGVLGFFLFDSKGTRIISSRRICFV